MANDMIIVGILLMVGAAVYYFRGFIIPKVKGWRTIIWNFVIATAPTVGFIADQLQLIDFKQFLTPLNAALAGLFIAVIGFWLRAITTGPVGSKS